MDRVQEGSRGSWRVFRVEDGRVSRWLLAFALLLAGGFSAAQTNLGPVSGLRLRILHQKNYLWVGDEQLVEVQIVDASGRRIRYDRVYPVKIIYLTPGGTLIERPLNLRPPNLDMGLLGELEAPGKWKAYALSSELGQSELTEWEVRPQEPR